MLWLNIIIHKPVWLSLGFFLQRVISLCFFLFLCWILFSMLRLYYLWHIIKVLFICVFCSNIFERKEIYFSRSGRETDYLKKTGSCFQQFDILLHIYKTCALQMHFWKWGKWHFFLGSLTSEYQEQQSLNCNRAMSKSGW